MSRGFDAELLVRVEEAGVNASAPREQLWIDGWLVRFSPGKAKRARCIQAVAPGRFPLEARLQRCFAVYAAAGLRPCIRVTPFSEPTGLDERLDERGMERIDDTRVMIAPLPLSTGNASAAARLQPSLRFEPTDAATYAEWIGTERASSPEERSAHAHRLQSAPVPHRALRVVDAAGSAIAGGQVAIEGDLAGLYDVLTTPTARGRGIGEALCRELLNGSGPAARYAYLQVDATNEVARRLYRRLGFEDAYAYHYRSPAIGRVTEV